MDMIGIGLIGTGGIALANHVPGITLHPQGRLVALCDTNSEILARAAQATGVSTTTTNYEEVLANPAVNAVIIATPNMVHAPITRAAVAAGKHVLCEKPLALNLAEAISMLEAAEAAGVRHMTAFTYRFVPAMRYMAHLVKSGALGEPYHFRANRFQDWGQRNLGWRQVQAQAGSGELGDMLSHRIDYAHLLIGPIQRVVGQTRLFVPSRSGAPADVEDWVGVLAEFEGPTTGVLESTKLATGRGEGGRSLDVCEVNGSEMSVIYSLNEPHSVKIGRASAAGLEEQPVPEEFLRWPGSPRNPHSGDPVATFRYDQDVEFIDAILEGRSCVPSFREGVQAQAVMEAVYRSTTAGCWVPVPQVVAGKEGTR